MDTDPGVACNDTDNDFKGSKVNHVCKVSEVEVESGVASNRVVAGNIPSSKDNPA